MEITLEQLKRKIESVDADGLCNCEAECGCPKEHLAPCGCSGDELEGCRPAWKGKPPAKNNIGADENDDWFYPCYHEAFVSRR